MACRTRCSARLNTPSCVRGGSIYAPPSRAPCGVRPSCFPLVAGRTPGPCCDARLAPGCSRYQVHSYVSLSECHFGSKVQFCGNADREVSNPDSRVATLLRKAAAELMEHQRKGRGGSGIRDRRRPCRACVSTRARGAVALDEAGAMKSLRPNGQSKPTPFSCRPHRCNRRTTKVLRHAMLISCALIAGTSIAAAVCGTRGGPGYRGSDGQCVSWQALGSKCGSPPTTRCTPENIAPEAGAGAKKGDEIQEMKKRQHEAIGVR
jgi:hypothetical protein